MKEIKYQLILEKRDSLDITRNIACKYGLFELMEVEFRQRGEEFGQKLNIKITLQCQKTLEKIETYTYISNTKEVNSETVSFIIFMSTPKVKEEIDSYIKEKSVKCKPIKNTEISKIICSIINENIHEIKNEKGVMKVNE